MHQTLIVRLIGLAIWPTLLGCLLLVSDTASPERRQSIAYLGAWTAASDVSHQKFVAAFKLGHPELFKRVAIDYVQIPSDDKIAALLEQALRRSPSLVLAPTGTSAVAAQAVVGQHPLIFASYIDPINLGLVDQNRHRHRHRHRPRPIAGISLADMLDLKRMELLRLAFPTVRSVVVLVDRSWWEASNFEALRQDARKMLGINLSYVLAESADDVRALARRGDLAEFDAWYVPGTYVAYLAEPQIIALLRSLGKPAIHSTVQEVENGAVIAYEQDSSFAFGALADLTARVLSGEDARSIPIERPRRFVLAVRADAEAIALGLSPAILRQADLIYREPVGSPDK